MAPGRARVREVFAFIDAALFLEAQRVGLCAVQSAATHPGAPGKGALARTVGERLKTATERACAEQASGS